MYLTKPKITFSEENHDVKELSERNSPTSVSVSNVEHLFNKGAGRFQLHVFRKFLLAQFDVDEFSCLPWRSDFGHSFLINTFEFHTLKSKVTQLISVYVMRMKWNINQIDFKKKKSPIDKEMLINFKKTVLVKLLILHLKGVFFLEIGF